MRVVFLYVLFSLIFFAANSQAVDSTDIVFTKVEQEAKFPGGMQGWLKFMQDHLRADVPQSDRARAGIYKVTISFVVDREGNVRNVRAVERAKTLPFLWP
jgi:protein TonB